MSAEGMEASPNDDVVAGDSGRGGRGVPMLSIGLIGLGVLATFLWAGALGCGMLKLLGIL